MLGDLELIQVQEILSLERRVLAEHQPPGMAGSLLQNMGRRPLRLSLAGIATGADAAGFVDRLETLFKDGSPLAFTADIVADADLEQVSIADLKVEELAGRPQRYAYTLTLCEYIEPVEPPAEPPVDADLLDEAQGLMSSLVPGLDAGLAFATGLERFVAPFGELLSRLQTANAAMRQQSAQ
jgi:hypothetical protein